MSEKKTIIALKRRENEEGKIGIKAKRNTVNTKHKQDSRYESKYTNNLKNYVNELDQSTKKKVDLYTWKNSHIIYKHQFSLVAQSWPTLCNPMNRSTPGLPVHHHLLEL